MRQQLKRKTSTKAVSIYVSLCKKLIVPYNYLKKKHSFNAEEIRHVGDKPLRNVLDSLGGWPVAVKNWTPPAFSIESMLGRLRGEYSEAVLVELYVGADDKNSSVNILQVKIWIDNINARWPSTANASPRFITSNYWWRVELKNFCLLTFVVQRKTLAMCGLDFEWKLFVVDKNSRSLVTRATF